MFWFRVCRIRLKYLKRRPKGLTVLPEAVREPTARLIRLKIFDFDINSKRSHDSL